MTAIAHAPVLGARLLRTAARGAALVGVAIIVGIILIAVVNGSGSPGSSGGRHATGPTHPSIGSTTTTAGKQVKIAVFNGSGVSGAATAMANKLRGLGYAIVTTGNAATTQTGTTVACKSAVSAQQADTLAKSAVVGATVQPFPSPPPSTATAADCIVTVGK